MGLSVLFVLSICPASAQIFGTDMQEPSANEAQEPAAQNSAFHSLSRKTQPAAQPAEQVEIKEVEVSSSTGAETKAKQQIILYMRNFRITSGFHGSITCSMDFYVTSTLSEKLSNISYRLKWPDMETSLTFENVQPGETLYRSYALLGKGCYHMDTMPNVIVNRCRVKGISQQDCASFISWMP